MTDRIQALRLEGMKRFGFGPDVMKQTKVCRVCGGTADAVQRYCSDCGAELPRETLFDLYKSHHLSCTKCGTVVASTSAFCPECGTRLKRRTLSLPCGRADYTNHTVRSPGKIPERNKEELHMKAKMKPHKLLSLLLALVMVVGLLPMGQVAYAYSEGEIAGTTGSGTEADPIIVDTFAELKAALELNEDLYITVNSFETTAADYTGIYGSKDYTNRSYAIRSYGKKVLTVNTTIDVRPLSINEGLYGFIGVFGTLEINGTGTIACGFNSACPNAVLDVIYPGVLIVNDGITIKGGYGMNNTYHGIAVRNYSGTVTINGGAFWGNSGTTDGSTSAFVHGNGATTINGGSFNVTINDSNQSYGLSDEEGNDKITLSGGTYQGIEAASGKTIGDMLATGYHTYNANTLVATPSIETLNNSVENILIMENTPVVISVNSTDNNKGTVTGSGTYSTGTSVTITATPKEGYEFDYWTNKYGEVVSGAGASYTFTATESMQYDAWFKAKSDVSTLIETVELTVTELVAGTNPQNPTVADSRLVIGNTEWRDKNDNGLSPVQKFVAGETYTLMARVRITDEAKATTSFITPITSLSAKVNGKDAVKGAIGDGTQEIVVSIPFVCKSSSIAPTITTSTLPGGKVGTAYEQTLAATGDTPITWTLDSGNLPDGLSLGIDGKISGTPTTAGDYTFTVKATNGAGSDTKSFTVTIVLPVEVVVTTQDKDGNVISTSGGEATADKTEVAKGETITVTVTPNPGFELESIEFSDGVTGSYQAGKVTSFTVPDDFTTSTGKLQIDVFFKETTSATTRTVTFKDGENTLSTQTVNEGDKATKPADPTKTGYTFGGWYADATFAAAFDFDQAITTNTTVYAKFTLITVTGISIKTPGKTAYTVGEALDVSGMTIKVDYSDGTSATIPVTAAMVSGFDSSAPATSQTLTITYEGKTTTYDVSISDTAPVTYDITVSAGANGTASASAASATAGTTITVTATPDSGYELDKITYTPEGGSETDITSTRSFTMPAAKVTVNASFKASSVTPPVPTTYTVTFKDGENTLSTQTVNEGDKATKPADPTKTGYTFNGWYADATFGVVFDFDQAITANTTVYAKFTDNSVTPPATITYTVTGGANSTWTKGSSSTVTITVKRSEDDANCIYHFDSVEIDGTALVKDTDYTVVSGSTVVTLKAATLQKLSTGSHTVTVKFDDGKVSTDITVKAASGSTDKPTSPKTGDDSNLRLWVLLMLMSILGFITTVAVGRKKHQHSR